MKKKKLLFSLLFVLCICVWADTARFSDIGFSPDGLQYLFGQCGELAQIDGGLKGYAEFFAVDTAKNEFVKDGTFKISASGKTAGKSGESVLDELITNKDSFINNYQIPSESNSVVLYQVTGDISFGNAESVGLLSAETIGREAVSSPVYKDVVEFRDFDNPLTDRVETYKVRLNEFVEGKGKNAESCFCLLVERRSANEKQSFLVGNPELKRKGVTGYRLNRVLRDASGKTMVFVIEKQVEESFGPSVRFMVETLRLAE